MSDFDVYEAEPVHESAEARCRRWARIYRARAAATDSQNARHQYLQQARMYEEQSEPKP